MPSGGASQARRPGRLRFRRRGAAAQRYIRPMAGSGKDGSDRPIQTIVLRDGLVTETDPPRLIGSFCAICELYHFPEVAVCPYCGAFGPLTTELSDRGRLWAWTAVCAPPPGYRGEVPYGFGVVELPEQRLRVMTRLTEPEPSNLDFDQPMHLEVVPLHRDDAGRTVLTYAYGPDRPGDPGPGAGSSGAGSGPSGGTGGGGRPT